jgi:hypothetical protein
MSRGFPRILDAQGTYGRINFPGEDTHDRQRRHVEGYSDAGLEL